MCGIAGIVDYSTNSQETTQNLVADMLHQIRHRGPEESNVVRIGEATLGHCLLSFTRRKQMQPTLSSCGSLAVVFNGEIYNLAELACARGFGDDATEGEILLDYYRNEGPEFVARLRGMFVIALVDTLKKRVVLFRDPFGKKPLHYLQTNHGVIFASELKALMRCAECPREVDSTAVAQYLFFNAVPAPLTILKNVYKVRPGTWIEFGEQGMVRERTYWTLPRASRRDVTKDTALKELEQHLVAALERRLNSTDQPFGFALSGGIDSSLLAALTSKRLHRQLPAFSIGFESASFDESRQSSLVAAHLGLEHHLLRVNGQQLADLVFKQYGFIDEPVADASLIPMLALCGFAKKLVKGLIGGDGADELFLGYQFFQANRVMRQVERVVWPKAWSKLRQLVNYLPASDSNMHPAFAIRLLDRAMYSPPETRFYNATGAFLETEDSLGLSSFVKHADLSRLTDELRLFTEGKGRSDLDRLQASIICHFLRDVILARTDRASMLHSLEMRSPFLDVDLVEWSMTLPREHKFRRLQGKRVLRLLANQLLPQEIASRKKQGFRVPIARLLREELRDLLTDLLSVRNVKRVGLFEPRIVCRLVDEHLRKVRDHQKQLWSLLCFHLWFEHFMQTDRPSIYTKTSEQESYRIQFEASSHV